jgi:DDE superfamily endonuclease
MLDETIVTETPPLYVRYGPIGGQAEVPLSGHRAKRILHGAINARTGEVALLVTAEWDGESHQTFLQQIHSHWRGWHIVLFEDRGSAHTASESQALARTLGIEIRWLPVPRRSGTRWTSYGGMSRRMLWPTSPLGLLTRALRRPASIFSTCLDANDCARPASCRAASGLLRCQKAFENLLS